MEVLNLIRRLWLREKRSLHEITRRTFLSRNIVKKYLKAEIVEPKFDASNRPSKLDPLSAIIAHGTVWRDCIAEGLRLIQTPHGGGDEKELRDEDGACGAGCEGYPARDAQAAYVSTH
jgi:hypothetical protein